MESRTNVVCVQINRRRQLGHAGWPLLQATKQLTNRFWHAVRIACSTVPNHAFVLPAMHTQVGVGRQLPAAYGD